MLVLKDLATMLLVGDGVIGAVAPDRHLRRWTGGRWPVTQTTPDAAARQRLLLRLSAVAEAAVALYFAVRLPAPRAGQPS